MLFSERHTILRGVGLLLAAFCGLWVAREYWSRSQLHLPAGITHEEYEANEQELRDENGQSPSREELLLRLGEKHAEHSEWDVAWACFSQIPSSQPAVGPSARYLEAQVLMQLERFGAAEECLREFLRINQRTHAFGFEHRIRALRYMSSLLATELRFDERQAILSELISLRVADRFEVLAYHFPSSMAWNNPAEAQRVERALAREPNNLALRIALGRYRTGEGQVDAGRQILKDCWSKHTEHLPAAAALLECLIAAQDWSEAGALLKSLPQARATEHPLLVRLRGEHDLHVGEFEAAKSCFEEVLRQHPTQSEALLGLAAAARKLNDLPLAQTALRQAQGLARIQTRVAWAVHDPDDPLPLLEILTICKEVGFNDTAREIAVFGQQTHRNDSRFQDKRR